MKPGAKPKLSPRDIEWARARWQEGIAATIIAQGLRISRDTVRAYARKYDFGRHPKDRSHLVKAIPTPPTVFACRKCGMKCESEAGHSGDCAAWVQYRYRIGVAA